MKRILAALHLFFTSQAFSDGLRITIAVLLPALAASFYGSLQLGMLLSLGAVCVSMVDMPGAIVNRTNSMLFCLLFVFVTALLTELVRSHLLLLGILVPVASFFYSMFVVYGIRGGAVGNAALLVLVLTMDHPNEGGIGMQSLLILIGGLWYLAVSLLHYRAAPFRPAQRSLAECIRELAEYLEIKADFYDTSKDLDKTYDRLVAQQIVVSEKQDAVREVMFKTRQVVKDASPTGRRLLLAFTDAVDLFEEITATYQDYRALRSRFAATGILARFAALARTMSKELQDLSLAIQAGRQRVHSTDYNVALQALKNAIDALPSPPGEQGTLVLKKLLVNLRRMMQRLQDLRRYFGEAPLPALKEQLPLDRFVGHQSLDPKLFANNLNLQSSVFRHSLRVAIAALAGFIISKFFAQGHHSYWILMTIIFMLKPSFSLTRQRNVERIAGTLAGGVIGVVLLRLISQEQVLFSFMVFFMLGCYSFMRTRYLLSVVFMTPFILILFHFVGIGFMALLQERVIDTLVGCLIALAAGYLLFPSWESEQLSSHLRDLLKANSNYLFRVAEMLAGKTVSVADYKLARKEVYVSSANLSSAFQRMLTEPRRKQVSRPALQQFVVLNHILFSNTATVAASLLHKQGRAYPAELTRSMRKVLNTICAGLVSFESPCSEAALESLGTTATEPDNEVLGSDELLLKDQLAFMHRLSEDIVKAAKGVRGL